jgi:hypothetical protein
MAYVGDYIQVKTKKAYDAKWKEIEGQFQKVNPKWPGTVHRNNPRYRTWIRTWIREHEKVGYLGIFSIPYPPGVIGFGITSNPKKYPNGVRLCLTKKCPYCSEVEVPVEETTWGHAVGYYSAGPMPGGKTQAMLAIDEIKRLNPGICYDCADKCRRENSTKQSKGKGFWDSFFG